MTYDDQPEESTPSRGAELADLANDYPGLSRIRYLLNEGTEDIAGAASRLSAAVAEFMPES
jgi:hypothetical protein